MTDQDIAILTTAGLLLVWIIMAAITWFIFCRLMWKLGSYLDRGNREKAFLNPPIISEPNSIADIPLPTTGKERK